MRRDSKRDSARSSVLEAPQEHPPNHKRLRTLRWPWIAAAAALVILIAAVALVARHWPFTKDAVVQRLQEKFATRVDIQTFRSIYFPHPGCIAEGVTLRRAEDGNVPPLATIQKLTIQGSYTGFFTTPKHLEQIRADGLHITIPPKHGTVGSSGSKKSVVIVNEIIANGAVLEFLPKEPDQEPVKFQVRQSMLKSVGDRQPVSFAVTVLNPKPPGEITTSGQFGPLRSNDLGQTPISGTYTFQHADLGVFKSIGGMLSSSGKYNGVLGRVDVEDATDVADFELKRAGHKVHLTSKFHAIVDGTTGDTLLERVESHFQRTTIISKGDVLGKPGQPGKTVSLDMSVRNGRIQDLMRLIMKSDRPPLMGVVSLNAKAVVPPEKRHFLEKVRLQGDFGIIDAQFTKEKTQHDVNVLSERSRGEKNEDDDPEHVISDLKGHVVLRDGIATLTNVSFTVPGALAHMEGTYNLLNQEVNLHGTLRMDATLSQATKGVKSFFLKALDPFFKKKNAGAVVPVSVTGTYKHPKFGVSLFGKK